MRDWLGRRKYDTEFADDAPLDSVRYVALDTELTSLDEKTNRLLSAGAIRMNGTRIAIGEQFYQVANPGVAVPAESIVIHRLRPADVEHGEPTAKVLEELLRFIGGAVLVGHFAQIDLNVLRKEMKVLGKELRNPAICTARIQRWILKQQRYSEDQFHQLEQMDLATLAKQYQLEVREAHHALDDAFVTARLWQKMIHRLEGLGVKSFAELMKIGGV